MTTFLKELFNAGEFGARMHARVQFDKYANGGAVYQNILPLPQGGWTSRSGFRYIASSHTSTVRPWLIPFIFSTEQAYMLELGESTLRFFRNQAAISAADVTAAITNGAFTSDVTGWTDNSNGTGAIAYDAGRMSLDGAGSGNEALATQAITITETTTTHVLRFQVVGDAGDEILVRVGTASGGASADLLTAVKRRVGWHTLSFDPSSNATVYLTFENTKDKSILVDDVEILDGVPIEITTPWTEAQLPDISYAQSADVIYMCIGGSTRPYRLERANGASWSLVLVLFEDGPWLSQGVDGTTLLAGATSGNAVTFTASQLDGINDGAGFRSTDVGRVIRWRDAAAYWHWMQIVSVTDTLNFVADIKGTTLSAVTATTDWRMGKWNDTDGWPAVVGFVQQRLGFANTTKWPQTFWLSESANIETFRDEDTAGVVQANSAIDYRFAALQVNTIRWLAMRKVPIVGTQGGNWTLRSEGAVLTPDDISADFEVTGGVARVQPVEVGNRLLFAQTQSRKIVEFADVLGKDGVQGFDSFDLTLLNDRILTGGLLQMMYAQEPDSFIWMARFDGQAPVLTYQPDQDVVGWSRQIHGGAFSGGISKIVTLATIPGQDGSGQFKDSSGRHEVWAGVQMTVNGQAVHYIECAEKIFRSDEDLPEEAFYVDSGLTLDVPIPITAITSADPGVLTVTAHGVADGSSVRIVRVRGMTELNTNVYKTAASATNTVELGEIDGTAITAATKANPAQLTIPDHGRATGDVVHLHDAGGMVELNGAQATLTVIDDDTVTLDGVDSTSYTTYTIGGTIHDVIDTSAYTAYASAGEMRVLVSAVTGLDHLEGETVQVYADGFVQAEKAVAAGAITLDNAASVVHVGLSYERRWESLKLAVGAKEGTPVTKPKGIADLGVVVSETAEGALSFASKDEAGENAFTELDLRQASQINDDPVPLYSGEVKLGISAGHDDDLRLVIKGSAPVPSTVLAIVPEMDVSG